MDSEKSDVIVLFLREKLGALDLGLIGSRYEISLIRLVGSSPLLCVYNHEASRLRLDYGVIPVAYYDE